MTTGNTDAVDPTAAAVGSEPETLQVDGPSLAEKVKELMHEGNVRRIVVKRTDGETVLEIPVTAGVIGVALLPAVAAVGALAGLANDWSLEVYRRDDTPTPAT